MGFETTTLRDPVGCSNHWATGDSMASKGQFVGVDRCTIAVVSYVADMSSDVM